jgi:hypothetical protein
MLGFRRTSMTEVASKAETRYVHHTAVPAAVTAFSLISPAFARGRFPKMTLADVVLKRSYMDRSEATALAIVCGETVPPQLDADEFIAHLHDVIDRHDLHPFFGRYPDRPANFGIDVRPHGVNWANFETDSKGMADWRAAYKRVPPWKQTLVATVMWLYCGRKDCDWLKRLPHNWHAADALALLKYSGALDAD